MHAHPEKVTINKHETPAMPKFFKTNETNDHHHDSETLKAAKPKVDTHHQPVNHRPRQLSGRHH